MVLLDGQTLSVETLESLRRGTQKIGLTEEAWQRVEEARSVVEDILQRKEVVYGINTGFGNFADVVISPDKLQRLQENLIRSHAAGVGDPLNVEQTRALLVLRINCLAKGHSGISRKTLEQLIEAFNHSCLSFVPQKVCHYLPSHKIHNTTKSLKETASLSIGMILLLILIIIHPQGTVGASGDLAPLAHLALGLMGEGKMWDEEEKTWGEASEILKKKSLSPLTLQAKEGLALINGTQLITSLGNWMLAHSPSSWLTKAISSRCGGLCSSTQPSSHGRRNSGTNA